MIEEILTKEELNYEDVLTLLNIDNESEDYFKLLFYSQKYARTHFKKGYIFVQIGLNTEPCSGNCKFCSMARDNYQMDDIWSISEDDLERRIKNIPSYVSDVFLMTTADYDKEIFLKNCIKAKKILGNNQKLVANIGDFDLIYAKKLKEAGVDACYHIRRLKEGIDTDISIEERERTINAIQEAGIELYYCIEPIGKEHTYEEIANEIIYAKNQKVNVMAVMRRVGLVDDQKEKDINLIEITKIAAATMLAVKPNKSMNVHEPNEMTLIAGVNQLYAEEGGNPRDTISETNQNRGISTKKAKEMLHDANWELYY